MKKFLIILFSFFATTKTIAQIQIVDLYGSEEYSQNGVYYKDVTNYLNQYIGTWLYTDGSTSLKIKFEKRFFTRNYPNNNTFYIDALVGEYQYINNGVEIFNTLNNLNISHQSPFDYSIYEFVRLENDPSCTHCVVPFQRLLLRYDEPTNDNMTLKGNMGILTFTENGQTKMWMGYATDYGMGMRIKKGDPDTNASTTELTLPNGIYIFTKIE
ncbi:DUF6705 family protein [Empedobacter brevis]